MNVWYGLCALLSIIFLLMGIGHMHMTYVTTFTPGEILHDVIVYDKIYCITNGVNEYYIVTDKGRFNVSFNGFRSFSKIPLNTPIDIELEHVYPFYNDDPRCYKRIYNSPCVEC